MTRQYHAEKDRLLYLAAAHGPVYGACPPWFDDGSPGSVTIYDRRLGPYLGDLRDGAPVVDMRAVEYGDVARDVIAGPIVCAGLTHDEGTGPLDRITVKTWLDRVRKLAGSRIGWRRGDRIEWEDGETTEIPDASARWLALGDL